MLRHKKAGLFTIAAAVVLTGAAVIGLMTARDKPVQMKETLSIIGGQDGPTSVFVASKVDREDADKMKEIPDMAWLSPAGGLRSGLQP